MFLKPGRKLSEYMEEDGIPKIHCFTCANRNSIKELKIGDWLCSGGEELRKKCVGENGNFLLWKPRVDYNIFIKNKDFSV